MPTKSVAFRLEVTPAPPTPDYFPGIAPAFLSVFEGVVAAFQVSISGLAGFAGPVTLFVGGLPEAASASFDANPLVLTGAPDEVLTTGLEITTDGVLTGSYDLTLEATAE